MAGFESFSGYYRIARATALLRLAANCSLDRSHGSLARITPRLRSEANRFIKIPAGTRRDIKSRNARLEFLQLRVDRNGESLFAFNTQAAERTSRTRIFLSLPRISEVAGSTKYTVLKYTSCCLLRAQGQFDGLSGRSRSGNRNHRMTLDKEKRREKRRRV